MLGNNQNQNAGDNSQQVQALVYINHGIDEKKVHEIFDERFNIVRKELTLEAQQCAYNRVQQFERALIFKMQQIDGALNMFADPAFQVLLTNAQKTAAVTERTNDYEILAELLACRVTKRESRKTRTGIDRAVEIVNQIDDDALCALTVVHAVQTYIPTSGIVREGLEALDDLFDRLMYMDLPDGDGWIEHLDILGAIRISPFGGFKIWRSIIPNY